MRDRSPLTSSLRDFLGEIGSRLRRRQKLNLDARDLVERLGEIDPLNLSKAESDIVLVAELHRWHRRPTIWGEMFLGRLGHAAQLRSTPGLEFLFLFHRDGRLREAALRKIEGPIPNAFLFAAIAWRLNDWVYPVRMAALDCAERAFPLTEPSVVARAALVLLNRRASWARWGSNGQLLDAAFERADVLSSLVALIAKSPDGPLATLLRHSLSTNVMMDDHLERLATVALQPSVRAVAMQSLIDGFATWPAGWRWRWIDKSMGIRRRERVLEKRPLVVGTDPHRMIRIALVDRAAAVRNVAIQSLIQRCADMDDARSLALKALGDRSAAVREKAAFVVEYMDRDQGHRR
jgi:hypothetical protein